MADLLLETFEPLVGESFVLRAADGHIEAQLTEATALPAPAGVARTPFSLVWRGPLDPPLAQGMHAVEHHDIGTELMFIVPIGRSTGGHDYQAIFS
jgi:hypothetical protein